MRHQAFTEVKQPHFPAYHSIAKLPGAPKNRANHLRLLNWPQHEWNGSIRPASILLYSLYCGVKERFY